MATATASLDILTIGEIAERAGAPTWAVRRTLDAMGFARRVGPSMRIIDAADLPLVIEELDRRGYLGRDDDRRHPADPVKHQEPDKGFWPSPGSRCGSSSVAADPTPGRIPYSTAQGPPSDEIVHD